MSHQMTSLISTGTRLPRKSSAQGGAGSGSAPCSKCATHTRDTKTAIANGLRLIRVRFGIPNSELPDLSPSNLSRYHIYMLGKGKVRDPCPFPRRQSSRRDKFGLCKLQRLSRAQRWELAMSIASLKRALPPPCKRHTPSSRDSFVRRVTSSPPPSLMSISPFAGERLANSSRTAGTLITSPRSGLSSRNHRRDLNPGPMLQSIGRA
jgi:hypothetical protein